jgi:hypothetical protein
MTKIEELKAQLREEEQKERELNKKTDEENRIKRNEITKNPDNWIWHITPGKRHDFLDNDKELNGATIGKRLKQEILDKYQKTSVLVPDDANFIGMFYYRTDENILDSEGGGHMVLKTPKLCSDEEWKQIMAGNIPTKFIR